MKLFDIDNFSSYTTSEKAIVRGKKIIFLYKIFETIISTDSLFLNIIINNVIYKYYHKYKYWHSLIFFIKNKYAKNDYKDIFKNCAIQIRKERYSKTRAIT